MLHLTLNTGKSIEQSLDDIDKAAVELLRPLVKAWGGSLPALHGAFRVEITRLDGGGVLTVSQADGPVANRRTERA